MSGYDYQRQVSTMWDVAPEDEGVCLEDAGSCRLPEAQPYGNQARQEAVRSRTEHVSSRTPATDAPAASVGPHCASSSLDAPEFAEYVGPDDVAVEQLGDLASGAWSGAGVLESTSDVADFLITVLHPENYNSPLLRDPTGLDDFLKPPAGGSGFLGPTLRGLGVLTSGVGMISDVSTMAAEDDLFSNDGTDLIDFSGNAAGMCSALAPGPAGAYCGAYEVGNMVGQKADTLYANIDANDRPYHAAIADAIRGVSSGSTERGSQPDDEYRDCQTEANGCVDEDNLLPALLAAPFLGPLGPFIAGGAIGETLGDPDLRPHQ